MPYEDENNSVGNNTIWISFIKGDNDSLVVHKLEYDMKEYIKDEPEVFICYKCIKEIF